MKTVRWFLYPSRTNSGEEEEKEWWEGVRKKIKWYPTVKS
jgi:Ni,Fe-hydrogenase I cytochrome b subunit